MADVLQPSAHGPTGPNYLARLWTKQLYMVIQTPHRAVASWVRQSCCLIPVEWLPRSVRYRPALQVMSVVCTGCPRTTQPLTGLTQFRKCSKTVYYDAMLSKCTGAGLTHALKVFFCLDLLFLSCPCTWSWAPCSCETDCCIPFRPARSALAKCVLMWELTL